MAANEDFILELLIKHGFIQPSDMEEARHASSQNGHGRWRSSSAPDWSRSSTSCVPRRPRQGVDVQEKIESVSEEAVKAVPGQLAFRLSVMPLNLEGRHLRVALADPFNFDAIDTLSKELRYDIDPVVSPQEQIEQALKRHYGNTAEQLSGLVDGDSSACASSRQ